MKRYLLSLSCAIGLITCPASYANWYKDIINAINAQGKVSNYWLSNINANSDASLAAQNDIDKLMGQLNSNMTSHSGWGSYQYHDYQSYDGGAQNWSGVMQMAGGGSGSGHLGQMMGDMSHQFPADSYDYNNGVGDSTSQKYYVIKTQTILAARALSQYDFDKIQNQIEYQQMLMQQVEKTKDLKAAMDLSNRIQIEGNLINLEVLRQTALANQQQAITDQASVNGALANAKFLKRPSGF